MNQAPASSRNAAAAYVLSVARIMIGLLFLQHGAEKLWGFAGGRIDAQIPSDDLVSESPPLRLTC